VSVLVRMRTRGLLRDTTHLSIGQGLRLIIQAGYFVLLARSLGPDAYGAFVTVVAMAALLGPFSGLGTANLFIKNVRSGKRDAQLCWGNGILLTVLSGSLLTCLGVGLSALLHLNTVPMVVTIVCVADLVLLKVTELAAFGFAALDHMKQTSIQSVVVSLLRFGGIATLLVTRHRVTLDIWVFTYLLTSLLGMLYSLAKGQQFWGRPVMDWRVLREDASEGVFFSVAGSATTIYNDIDKIMLSRLADLAATGVYGAAYRVIDVTMTPVRSLAAAAYPHFFRKGVGGMTATYPYALSLIAKTSIYGGSDRALHSGEPVRGSGSGGALAGIDTVFALPALFHGRCAVGRRATAHPHWNPGGGCFDQYWPECVDFAAVFLARRGMDEPGV
jgi:O-antigen/teichoic acid export membrane protein